MKGVSGKALAVAAALCVMSIATYAQADDFNFTFQSGRFLSVPFEGTIYGLASSGQSDPTSIYITPNYALFEQEVGEPLSFFGVTLNPYTFTTSNSDFFGYFDVEGGQVVGASFSALSGPTNAYFSIPNAENGYLNEGEYNGFEYDSQDAVTEGGFPLVITSAAPEPSMWALMITGVAMVGGFLRWGRKRELIAAV